jgi:hypothetical protein
LEQRVGERISSKLFNLAGASSITRIGEKLSREAFEDGTFVPLSFRSNRVVWQLAALPQKGNMELAVVVVAILVAGALIPGNSQILFYR